jgi:N-methylhydantoinase A/oxoprolinase/acetone carboxylase beta subunit
MSERLCADGTLHEPLDEGAVLGAAARATEAGIGAFAICFPYASLSPAYKLRAAELSSESFSAPDVVASKAAAPRGGCGACGIGLFGP